MTAALARRYAHAAGKVLDVFLHVRTTYPRDWAGSRDTRPEKYIAGWVTRRTSHEMWRSGPRLTEEEAVKAARAWLVKHPDYRDTTTGRHAPVSS